MIVALNACLNDSQSIALLDSSSITAPGSRGYALYQANCAACHGASGRGNGVAAIALKIRPRDFWNEPFRYVSTMDGIPTSDDLAQTIRSGRLLGEMPASPWLSDEDVRALAEYVLEFNRLGWVERLSGDESMSAADVEEIASDRVTPLEPIVVSMPSPDFRPSSEVGRSLYVQACASCHGPSGRGNGLNMPLDDRGRQVTVRDLTSDPIRGGASPTELFKRIRCGVPGTPMPAQPALTDDQVWQLVFYTRQLMGRPLGQTNP
ncbi:MAG: cytochrome c [Planctomycetes bacterium]|nr:cytochrome c [Planctomycetota bacterium]